MSSFYIASGFPFHSFTRHESNHFLLAIVSSRVPIPPFSSALPVTFDSAFVSAEAFYLSPGADFPCLFLCYCLVADAREFFRFFSQQAR